MRATIGFLFVAILSGVATNPLPGEDDTYKMFQGDMLLSKGDIDVAEKGGVIGKEVMILDPSGAKALAGVSVLQDNKWPEAKVPFTLAADVTSGMWKVFGRKSDMERAIRSAIKEWESKTCVRFIERTNEADYVEFINGGMGECYSHVGKIGGKQLISLGMGCRSDGIAMHEIGHTLGLHHEQSRPDRDEFVKVNWDNIKTGMKSNFEKYGVSQVNTLGSPYDYRSIMHYADNAFAAWPWQKTVEPLKSGVSIGQRKSLSEGDAWQINKLYKCPGS